MINPSQHKPNRPEISASDPEHERRTAWITKVRTMHRNKRMMGFAGITLGAALVVWARLSPDQAPPWTLSAGFGVLGLSWALFIYVIVDRWLWVKRNPYRAEASAQSSK
jgi:hypothetical protein